jgi:TolB-like protein/DNA-binding winged helix-turn-helix (wHTH) protein
LDARTPSLFFGEFEVDLASGQLRKQGVRIKLQEQPFQTLVALIGRPGAVLTREELQKRLWPDGTLVDFDRGLNKAINRLREALEDDADNPRFIETLPLRGYRFLASVETAAATISGETAIPETLPAAAGPMSRRGLFASAGAIASLPLLYFGYRALFSFAGPIRSIAVLPLENLSGNPAEEYFSQGMTDELIGEIARIGSLGVISRTSVMQYSKGNRKSLRAIARELNVDAIVEGTIVQSGDRVRITAQLIRASDDRHLWADEYVRDLTNVLELQGEVARAIAANIRIKLTPEEKSGLVRSRSVQPEAYDLFLQGNFFVQQGIRGTAKSIDLFRRSIELDPLQAASYAGLAEALCFAGIFGLRPASETYPQARAAALRALALDESNASAHDALGDVKQSYDYDIAGAAAEFRRALHLNPIHLLTRLRYAENLTRSKEYDRAIEETARTVALDPVSPISHVSRSMIFFRARRYDESIQESRRALELDPSNVNAFWWQGVAFAGKRDLGNAIAALTKGLVLNEGPLLRGYLGYVYAQAGHKEKALAILNELIALSRQRFVSPVDYALIHAGFGDADSTFTWLEKAYQAHETRIELSSLYYDQFRWDPRYANLMRRMGLPL